MTPALVGVLCALKIIPKEFYCQDCHFTWSNEEERTIGRASGTASFLDSNPAKRFVGQPVSVTGAIDSSRAILSCDGSFGLPNHECFLVRRRSSCWISLERLDHALPSMKWLFALLLALIIFRRRRLVRLQHLCQRRNRSEKGATRRSYASADARHQPSRVSGGGETATGRETDRSSRRAHRLYPKYPAGLHVEEAKDLLGEVNIDIFLSRYPSPEKTEYVVKSGDVLAKIARKLKTTPELIMRMNNLSGTMLHIGEHLLISHPDFSMVIQRKAKLVVLLNHGAFFKQYHVREAEVAA